jgi:hypothetical protein
MDAVAQCASPPGERTAPQEQNVPRPVQYTPLAKECGIKQFAVIQAVEFGQLGERPGKLVGLGSKLQNSLV